MPVSRKRTKAAPPRRETSMPPPEKALEVATLALVQASLELVREAELRITLAARAGDAEEVTRALEDHHNLRTAGLGMLVAYSAMADLPDPRVNQD